MAAARKGSLGSVLLLLAWLVLVVGLAGGVGYALLLGEPDPPADQVAARLFVPKDVVGGVPGAPVGSPGPATAGAVDPLTAKPAQPAGKTARLDSETLAETPVETGPKTGSEAGDPTAAELASDTVANLSTSTAAAPAPATEPNPADAQSATLPGSRSLVPGAENLRLWQRYAAPFSRDDPRPRIAVVLSGLGLSDKQTEAAIRNLPSEVTLSFMPYARDLENWIALARTQGHEVMLDLPMEPKSFPADDPGPQALITSLSPNENLKRLDWILGRGSAIIGVAGYMGSRFSATRAQLRPILVTLKVRGFMYLDNRPDDESVAGRVARQIGLPLASNDRTIDGRQASRLAIDARLAQVERIALTQGVAVAMGHPFPVTLERLSVWLEGLDQRGFVLAPVTAVVNTQAPY